VKTGPNAEHLHLEALETEVEAEVEAGASMMHTLSLPFFSRHSNAFFVSLSTTITFPFPFFRSLDDAGRCAAALQVCLEVRNACVPFTVLGINSDMRL
jgi:hypothetical protein